MPNSRISDLIRKESLISGQDFDDDALLLLARAKSHNETIEYKDFKKSVNDHNVFITGEQNVAGEKTFEDNTVFNKDVKVKGDLSIQGDVFNFKFEAENPDAQSKDDYESTDSGDAQYWQLSSLITADGEFNKNQPFKTFEEYFVLPSTYSTYQGDYELVYRNNANVNDNEHVTSEYWKYMLNYINVDISSLES